MTCTLDRTSVHFCPFDCWAPTGKSSYSRQSAAPYIHAGCKSTQILTAIDKCSQLAIYSTSVDVSQCWTIAIVAYWCNDPAAKRAIAVKSGYLDRKPVESVRSLRKQVGFLSCEGTCKGSSSYHAHEKGVFDNTPRWRHVRHTAPPSRGQPMGGWGMGPLGA